ncbi:MAG TPA: GntR family transcriptional regulator [Longimicrobiales bacterium]
MREERFDDEARLALAQPFRIVLDDASSSSIYEQIVAQVKEAVATGALVAGARLPAVRALADQLDIAPGTVARAYGELERLGVVRTEGARGTRVAGRSEASRARADHETIVGLLRPAAVAAYHMGAGAQDVRVALESAMKGIFDDPSRME